MKRLMSIAVCSMIIVAFVIMQGAEIVKSSDVIFNGDIETANLLDDFTNSLQKEIFTGMLVTEYQNAVLMELQEMDIPQDVSRKLKDTLYSESFTRVLFSEAQDLYDVTIAEDQLSEEEVDKCILNTLNRMCKKLTSHAGVSMVLKYDVEKDTISIK